MAVPLPPFPSDEINPDVVMSKEMYAWFNQLYVFLTANTNGGGGVLTALNKLLTNPPLTGGGSIGADLTIGIAPQGIDNTLLAHMPSNTVKGNNSNVAGQPEDLPFVSGTFNQIFQSGAVQFAGPNNLLTSTQHVEVGLNVPNPSGVNGPVLLLGTLGGSGTPTTFWIISDQAFDAVTPGNTLGITAGETQPSGTAKGGLLWLIGGAAFGGTGGETRIQGGTSLNGPAGQLSLFGGNSTNGPAGDVFVTAGQAGTAGANVHLIATTLNGVSGDVRIRINSTILIQFLRNGEIFLTQSGTGAGSAGQPLVSGGLGAAAKWLSGAFTGSVPTAKLNSTGTAGSLTFNNGILTSEVPPSAGTSTGTLNLNIVSASGSPAINFTYTLNENTVTLKVQAATTGTATGTFLQIGSLPPFLTPATLQMCAVAGIINNNVFNNLGCVFINGNQMNFGVANVSGANLTYNTAAFTGTIGLVAFLSFTYSLI